nr:ribonuclease H-like domain-containing protein [Tanacetum cinerariifolium]
MNQFCEMKGIMRQFSVARTHQQNKVAERRNRTIIEAARTMLDDSKLPTTFCTEAVNSACYVQNRVLVVEPHNKTPYVLFHSRTPNLSFMRPFGCPVTILNTKDHLGKFGGNADEGFFVRYSLNSKAFRVFNNRTTIMEENLHIKFSESTPNVVGSGPDWLFCIDALTKTMNNEPIVAGTQSNGFAGTKASDNADPKSYQDNGFKPTSDDEKKVDEDPSKGNECNDQEQDRVYAGRASTIQVTRSLDFRLQVKQENKGIFISQDKYVAEILKKFRFTKVKNASTPMESKKPLLKDKDGEEVDVHMYRSMISSLMYLTSSRPDIVFAVCTCARYQVNPKVSHFHVVKRIFSDYAGASLDRKSTKGGCQFLGCRLISWTCKKQTVVANSTTKAEYVAALSCCG